MQPADYFIYKLLKSKEKRDKWIERELERRPENLTFSTFCVQYVKCLSIIHYYIYKQDMLQLEVFY